MRLTTVLDLIGAVKPGEIVLAGPTDCPFKRELVGRLVLMATKDFDYTPSWFITKDKIRLPYAMQLVIQDVIQAFGAPHPSLLVGDLAAGPTSPPARPGKPGSSSSCRTTSTSSPESPMKITLVAAGTNSVLGLTNPDMATYASTGAVGQLHAKKEFGVNMMAHQLREMVDDEDLEGFGGLDGSTLATVEIELTPEQAAKLGLVAPKPKKGKA